MKRSIKSKKKDHTQGFILICGLYLFAPLEGVAQKFTVFRKSLSCTIFWVAFVVGMIGVIGFIKNISR